MFKILILFKKLKIKQIQVKSRVLRVLYAGKIHDYVVKVMYVYRVRVCDTRTRLNTRIFPSSNVCSSCIRMPTLEQACQLSCQL